MAKLSISIPDDLKELLESRAESEKVPVSHVVSDALKAYFKSMMWYGRMTSIQKGGD